MGQSWALAYFTVLSLKSIILLMMLWHAVALAQFLLPAFPSLWMLFGRYMYMSINIFSNQGLSVMVPEGCHSQGCRSYLPGLLGVLFSFTRHLPYTYIYVLSIGLICRYYHWRYNSNLSKYRLTWRNRQLGRDKREFEPMASALAWQKSPNNWQWRPTHWEHEHLYSKYYY